jgi:CubicO group peptidase (beta-lactamase class C family)
LDAVSENPLVEGWPGAPSVLLFRLRAGNVEWVGDAGDLDEVRPWASISKMAVALAFGMEVDWDEHQFTQNFGPRGATLANLLSHSSGLGLEEGDPLVPIATKRVYSNVGIDHAVSVALEGQEPGEWLDKRIFSPFGMDSTKLAGRPCADVVGSTQDLATLGVAWLRPDGVTKETRDRQIKPYLPDLAGIVPGFGRFTPCPWGLGPEVRGDKQHWMGDWPSNSFGHFGQSGSMMLLNAQEQIGLVATSTHVFGAWAVKLWPTWTSVMRQRILAS